MSRKDYVLIAMILRQYRDAAPELIDPMTETFARHLASSNPNFHYDRFVEAVRGAR